MAYQEERYYAFPVPKSAGQANLTKTRRLSSWAE